MMDVPFQIQKLAKWNEETTLGVNPGVSEVDLKFLLAGK